METPTNHQPVRPRPELLPPWIGSGEDELRSAAVSRLEVSSLFATDSYAVNRYRCGDTAADARKEKALGAHLLVFPHEGSFRIRCRAGTATVGPAEVALFERDMPYHTDHPCGCTDRGASICLSEDAAQALVEEWETPGRSPGGLFPRVGVPMSRRAVRARDRLMRGLRDGAVGDGLEFEETVGELLSLLRPRGMPSMPHHRASRDVAIAVADAIAQRFRESIKLGDLAASFDLSVYRLCRMFKHATGTTIGAYRARLRVHTAWGRLLDDPKQDLSDLALEMGFSSHSRFTEVFRRHLGFPPSAMRPPPSRTARTG